MIAAAVVAAAVVAAGSIPDSVAVAAGSFPDNIVAGSSFAEVVVCIPVDSTPAVDSLAVAGSNFDTAGFECRSQSALAV